MKKASVSLSLIMVYNVLIILISLSLGMGLFSYNQFLDSSQGQELDLSKRPESLAANKLFQGKTAHLATATAG